MCVCVCLSEQVAECVPVSKCVCFFCLSEQVAECVPVSKCVCFFCLNDLFISVCLFVCLNVCV